MRKSRNVIVLSVLFLFLGSYVLLAQDSQHATDLLFEEKTFDFGEIKEADGPVHHEFSVRNVGKQPLAISRINGSCGCMKFEYPKEPIRPGERRKIKLIYDPAYRQGFFNKRFVVMTSGNNDYTYAWVKGTVIPCKHPVQEKYAYDYGEDLWMNFKVMLFGSMAIGDEKSMTLKFTNDGPKNMHLTFTIVGGNTDIRFTNPGLLKPDEESEMVVTYRYSGKFPLETKLFPVVNGKRLALPLTITCFQK